ncbi:hypothetical protein ILYODFUR_034474, partial [Ilyodon furcidens]
MVLALFSISTPSLSRKITKPNSEEHTHACPPSNVPLKSQRRYAAEKGITSTGDYWNKSAHSLPTTDTVEKDLFSPLSSSASHSVSQPKEITNSNILFSLCLGPSKFTSSSARLDKFQSDPLTQSWFLFILTPGFKNKLFLNLLSASRDCVIS